MVGGWPFFSGGAVGATTSAGWLAGLNSGAACTSALSRCRTSGAVRSRCGNCRACQWTATLRLPTPRKPPKSMTAARGCPSAPMSTSTTIPISSSPALRTFLPKRLVTSSMSIGCKVADGESLALVSLFSPAGGGGGVPASEGGSPTSGDPASGDVDEGCSGAVGPPSAGLSPSWRAAALPSAGFSLPSVGRATGFGGAAGACSDAFSCVLVGGEWLSGGVWAAEMETPSTVVRRIPVAVQVNRRALIMNSPRMRAAPGTSGCSSRCAGANPSNSRPRRCAPSSGRRCGRRNPAWRGGAPRR